MSIRESTIVDSASSDSSEMYMAKVYTRNLWCNKVYESKVDKGSSVGCTT